MGGACSVLGRVFEMTPVLMHVQQNPRTYRIIGESFVTGADCYTPELGTVPDFGLLGSVSQMNSYVFSKCYSTISRQEQIHRSHCLLVERFSICFW
jgi:hypothetical protein